ncbi:hypothetical protein BH10PLA2_BH10PLA2_34160 [soil metagenome]
MEPKPAVNKLEAILTLARSDLGSRRKSPWRWIITGMILFAFIGAFAWWVTKPREQAQPILIMAADAIALPDESVVLTSRIENAAEPGSLQGLAGTPIVGQDSLTNTPHALRCDSAGLTQFTASFSSSELPISWFARFAGDANRKPVQTRGIVYVRPPSSTWIIIDADHALPALAEQDFWKREGIDVPLMPGALAALRELRAKHNIVYVSTSANSVSRHLRFKAWLGRGWAPALQQPPDGPLLSRATSDLEPAAFLQATVTNLQKQFPAPIVALAARPEEARAFLDAGVRTLLLGDAEGAPKGAVIVKSWNDAVAAKAQAQVGK